LNRILQNKPLILVVVWACAVGLAGGAATRIDMWYYGLVQPGWKPPDWAFGPAWTVIFALAGVAGYRAWHSATTPAQARLTIALFAVNSVLNIAWSVLFFTLQRPDWALIELPFLLLSIVVLIAVLRRRHPVIIPALIPYALWVSFAGTLNYAVVDLNGYWTR